MKIVILFFCLLLLTGCRSYKMENGKWSFTHYVVGTSPKVTVLEEADVASFTPLSREYAKDKQHVYWENKVLPGADPSTFIRLGKHYSKDAHRVFLREGQIKGADPASFQVVDGSNLLSKDKADFYCAERPLGVLDMNSFKTINDGWAKDAKAYYSTPNFSPSGRVECDYQTMKILSDEYAVDKRRAYYRGIPIEGVDVNTFRATGTIEARDQYRKYRGDEVDRIK